MPGAMQKAAARWPQAMRRLPRKVLPALGVMLVVGAGLLYYAAWVEPQAIEITHVDITLPRLDPTFEGYRLVQISDLHVGRWMRLPRLARIVVIINAQEPDLIAITGDFVTHARGRALLDAVTALSNLQAKDGVVAVLGNHDYWGRRGPRPVRRVIRDSGMIDLNNRVHTLARGGGVLHLAGVDSVRAGANRLDLVLAALPREGAAIFLAHEPDFGDVSAATGRFDLQLSGHSHGGQVALPLLGPPRLPVLGRKYPRGLYNVGKMPLYTNRGLGMVGLPFRFGARPEITVFTLHGT